MSSDTIGRLRPLLKWAGGKQWLAPSLALLYEMSDSHRLIEPFTGGASLYFSTRPNAAVLGDTNRTLISTYQTLKRHPDSIASELRGMTIDPHAFYQIRSEQPTTRTRIAARMIYLNRTAFGGLWRVNARGEFNVPFGCKPETALPSAQDLQTYSKSLRKARFVLSDFESTICHSILPRDFIYCDPPYTVSHNNNGFLRYNETIFRWSDQLRLAALCNEIAQCGTRVVVSNAAHGDVVELYDKGLFFAFVVPRASNLAAQVKYRNAQDELLLVSKSLGLTRQRISLTLRQMGLSDVPLRARGIRW